MRSRLLVLGLAVAALMGLRVNAESGATADPAPAPACAACGAPVVEETCTVCAPRPRDLFKGLMSLAGNSGFRLRVLRSGDPRMHHVRPGPSGRPVRNLCSGDPRMRLVRGSPSRTGLPHLRSTVLHRL